ncbi:GatB/YqeY domain-containing protein [Leeuwenhoekiella aequorea]|uniref:GatB/YqeY domain-containing protein n=1 Tax=Leeuwenhoekiella aequorea TaxID=283736 RepID=UPI00352D490C
MSLQTEVMTAMKTAMKAKDQNALASLRAIKSAILTAQTESGASEELAEEEEIKILQKLVKQRKDSAAIYKEQDRTEMAEEELAQAAVIEQFLPEQMSPEAIEKIVLSIIETTGATGMQDMGKVMGLASQELAGKADGKTISTIVRQKLA